MADGYSSAAGVGAKVLSAWHDLRVPIILGATFSYLYWRYCFYQPIATRKTSGGGSKRKDSRRPDSDDEDGNDDGDSVNSAAEELKEEPEHSDIGSKTSDELQSSSGDSPLASSVSSTSTATKTKTRSVKVFTRKVDTTFQRLSTASDIYIFYSTLTGTSEKYAAHLHSVLSSNEKLTRRKLTLLNIDYLDDIDSYFVAPSQELKNAIYLFVIPSYASESPLDFCIETLKETYNDFRIDSRPLRNLGGYAVFGLGDMESWDGDMYCYQAILIDKYLGKLGAARIFPVGTGDVKNAARTEFDIWTRHLTDTLMDPTSKAEILDIGDSDDETEDEDVEHAADSESTKSRTVGLLKKTDETDVVDVEDIGVIIQNSKLTASLSAKKEMVGKETPTYKALTKQGYTIVGSHSGVKICRWTKSALRGRGSCYKFAFYGIKSHLCMETTPSLSCSNKCVFCWRHGTNPVGTSWRWQVDPPEAILQGALEGHYKKIKQMRGIPGIQAARFAEAFTVRHCALSLVGEPIFYPHINEFVAMLHERHISSFLVCNAQHPQELKNLKQVTQLYVSIDASDKDSLRRIDKPLHRDFWERFNECLDILKTKSAQRTVFRLTLVKGFNAEEVLGYAKLVAQAMPCFIEVKGVTYCGSSSSSGPAAAFKTKDSLTMANVPFYEEVRDFVTQLNKSLHDLNLDYDIAAEHAHSCCILIAQKRFKINNEWYTHIDYSRFFELLEQRASFGPMDYIAKTPSWAQFGSQQAGFNPEDERVIHKSVAKRSGKLGSVSSRNSSVISLPAIAV
ncbi:uncharacterized protein V1518DRAFT_411917 [Limtongia smithiae]|uniref:uncharacterized protein n=1 Tax=Limtongia smithiae TaxID=1125753 RepID=UPI0034CE7557